MSIFTSIANQSIKKKMQNFVFSVYPSFLKKEDKGYLQEKLH